MSNKKLSVNDSEQTFKYIVLKIFFLYLKSWITYDQACIKLLGLSDYETKLIKLDNFKCLQTYIN